MLDRFRLALQLSVLAAVFGGAALGLSTTPADESEGSGTIFVSDVEGEGTVSPVSIEPVSVDEDDPAWRIWPVRLQEQPPLTPSLATPPPAVTLPSQAAIRTRLFGPDDVRLSLLSDTRRQQASGTAKSLALGLEAKSRAATDAGNLLGKVQSTSLGLGIQKRTPVVTDPRIRGGRVGRLPGSGSYWVPARIDLDTMLSKLDSRIIEDIVVVKGPYAARYGPGFSHLDVRLREASVGYDSRLSGGASSVEYKTNAEQWYGRQTAWGGGEDWGYRLGYGHRTGNDYVTGNGSEVPSSYNSRDWDFAFHKELADDRALDVSLLRLDQTGVEYPGQAFDMDFLLTNGVEVTYTDAGAVEYDRFEVEFWYNETYFFGNAQQLGKRRQFPIYDAIDFVGFTDVDSSSLGTRAAMTWGDPDQRALTTGADVRYLKQTLDEISSGRILFNIWQNANSPIPKSYAVNPGLFFEFDQAVGNYGSLSLGGRVDYVTTDVIDNPLKLQNIGINGIPYEDVLGSGQFDQNYFLWSLYSTGSYEISPCWTAQLGAGYAERPPSLTELYVAETFLFLLQNGLNTATGDPELDPERRIQVDLGVTFDNDVSRFGVNSFFAWSFDYITFENLRVFPDIAQPAQVQLKYVNTELATFVGGEAFAEVDLTERLTLFGLCSYLEGRDQTRHGTFATRQGAPGMPSVQVPGLVRGAFSGVTGANSEPLPSLPPLEGRAGVRLHPAGEPRWSIEVSARIARQQDRVATSLLETPTPGFTVWDIRGYWQATDAILLVGGVENFTDVTYREYLDFRSLTGGIQVFQPGINFYSGAEVTY